MKFDSNQAWSDAIAAVRANREVLLAVGGVFFMLPSLLSTVFLTDVQTQLMENLGKSEVVQKVIDANIGMLLGFGIGGMLMQVIGYLAVTALLSDRKRPTVGEAIGGGIRALPTMVVIGLAFMLGTMLASVVLTLIVGGLFTVIGAGAAGSVLLIVALLVLVAYAGVKLSLVWPVVVNDHVGNPLAAMTRSWRLTKGNSRRLFGFYMLLSLGYFVIAMVATIGVAGPVMLLAGQGRVAVLAIGLVSGAVGAAGSVIFTAILTQAHRQLAGSSAEAVAEPFE